MRFQSWFTDSVYWCEQVQSNIFGDKPVTKRVNQQLQPPSNFAQQAEEQVSQPAEQFIGVLLLTS